MRAYCIAVAVALLAALQYACGAAPQVIVIGAGFAGMTCARLAQDSGFDVTILGTVLLVARYLQMRRVLIFCSCDFHRSPQSQALVSADESGRTARGALLTSWAPNSYANSARQVFMLVVISLHPSFSLPTPPLHADRPSFSIHTRGRLRTARSSPRRTTICSPRCRQLGI